MRRVLVLTLAGALTASCATTGADPRPAPATVSLAVFHGALDPFGRWIVLQPYGEVWVPAVAPGWMPFTNGEWVWTDDGWLWIAADRWGSLPYHYGRWYFDPAHGWIWVPGTEWAPAWVVWRVGEDVVGWAPLPPGSTVWVEPPFPHDAWIFVPTSRFAGYPVRRYAYPPRDRAEIVGRTQPAPPPRDGARDVPPWGGPVPARIESALGRPVPMRRLVPAPGPRSAGRDLGDAVEVYRPKARSRPAPEGTAAVGPRPPARAGPVWPPPEGEATAPRPRPRAAEPAAPRPAAKPPPAPSPHRRERARAGPARRKQPAPAGGAGEQPSDPARAPEAR